MLVVWDLKWSCWQFSFTVGHCGAGRFCSEPQSWAWRLRVLPYVGPYRCQQQMCWTTRLRPWTPCLGRGCVHGLLAGVKKYAVNKKKNNKKLRIKVWVYMCVHNSVYLSVCLSKVRLRTHFIPVSPAHAHTCILILVWISMENIPDCNGSHLVMLLPCLPSHSTPRFPHRRHLEPIGGRVTPSHKALKGSQTHSG